LHDSGTVLTSLMMDDEEESEYSNFYGSEAKLDAEINTSWMSVLYYQLSAGAGGLVHHPANDASCREHV